MEIISEVTIDLGEIMIKIWRPTLLYQGKVKYRKNAEKFSRDFLNALPKLPISLDVPGALTFDVRFGRNSAVYKREKRNVTSTTSFASIMKVKKLRSQKIFAAKVSHFKESDAASTVRKRWESLTEEFQKIVKF